MTRRRALATLTAVAPMQAQAKRRARDFGICPGVLSPGKRNAITDVEGVRVGHVTLIQGDSVRTGVTAILPHDGNLFQQKAPAGICVGNAFGKLAGSTQVEELGNLETPIILTNTLSVAEGIAAVVEYTLSQPGNEQVLSVNAVVGETNDGRLNDIRGRHVTKEHVRQAIAQASREVAEGNQGAGTGTICFGFKGGIGTASRRLPASLGGYTVGVLVQTNYGGILQVEGVPVGRLLGRYYLKEFAEPAPGGSCMVVIATDAPLDARNLKRLAGRSLLGLAATGSSASNGSGEYALAFSTRNLVPMNPGRQTLTGEYLTNDAMSPLFQAVKEATEEAVYNSLFLAETMTGYRGLRVEALPKEKVVELLRRAGALRPR
ncbi:MAG: P1 family peptidase [Bryobacteraceae bacterium]|nr:P1 family peptidase [Bryobacteraceae bacterium]MDW8379239.1 P1 family peptidase [Bryobacterales bacterium]